VCFVNLIRLLLLSAGAGFSVFCQAFHELWKVVLDGFADALSRVYAGYHLVTLVRVRNIRRIRQVSVGQINRLDQKPFGAKWGKSVCCMSAHVCSEIILKWFLFAIYDLRAVLEFISVLDFFGHLSLSNPAETCKREF